MGDYVTAAIVPLIGGIVLGQEKVFGTRPAYLASYEPFAGNDSHILNYYRERDGESVPYHVLDGSGGVGPGSIPRADVIAATCPCAGLSQLSPTFGADNPANDWMLKTARFVLQDLRPRVFWGENAPLLAGKTGRPVRDKLFDIARDSGYTFTLYRTRSLLHGLPQVRERSFYFFWRGSVTPLLNQYNTKYTRIEDLLDSVTGNFQMEPINKKTPTDDPFYQLMLKEVFPGKTHAEVQQSMPDDKSWDIMFYLETLGYNYREMGKWFASNGFEHLVEKCEKKYEKLASGGSIMRRGVNIPKNYIHAFVGHLPQQLTHHREDRFVTYREGLAIMGFPADFELLKPKTNFNHICQNVPVTTAADMASEVKAFLDGERPVVEDRYVFQHNGTGLVDTSERAPARELTEFFA